MFEKMGNARRAGRFVGRADLVPNHMGDDRRAVVGQHHDFQAVFELEMSDVRLRVGQRRAGKKNRGGGQTGDGPADAA